MTTDTKTFGIKEILDALVAQAECGSCKTCRWCAPVGDDFGYRDEHPELTHYCMMQDINAIYFSQQMLDSKAYPSTCDVGTWENKKTGGLPLYACLAYQSYYEGFDDLITPETARQHRQFMRNLDRAIVLHNGIESNILSQLLDKLNSAIDSLPVALTDNPFPWPPRDPLEPRAY